MMLTLASLCLARWASAELSMQQAYSESDSLLMKISVLENPGAVLDVNGHTGMSGDTPEFKQSDLKNFFDHHFSTSDRSHQQVVLAVQRSCTRKKVLVSGMPRSGSTSLLTIAHIFMFFCDADYLPPFDNQSSLFIDDPHDCDAHSPAPKFCWSYFYGDRSSVLKTHAAKPDNRKNYPDVILFSSRSPDDMMASQWTSFYSDCPNPPCADWPHAMRELERQACLYEKFDSSKIKYDMSLEQLTNTPKDVLRDIALAMGVTDKDGKVPFEVVNMAESIFENVTSVIQKGSQSAHHSDENDNYREMARQMLEEGSDYFGMADGKNVKTRIDGMKWMSAHGHISANPLVDTNTTDNVTTVTMNNLFTKNFPLAWCRNPPVMDSA